MTAIEVHPEVEQALRAGRPVVAMETTVITAGMPRTPAPDVEAPGWDPRAPAHVEVARLLDRIVRAAGAVPAAVAVVDGALRIGLDDQTLDSLAASSGKVSAPDLAFALSTKQTAGTTISAALLAWRQVEAGRIRVLATGGIGGVHRDWHRRPDISADLLQLAATPVCVVASGAKSFLDIPATLEALETLGVPVIAFGTDHFPCFYGGGSDDLPAPRRLDDAQSVAELCRAHWETLDGTSGVLLANPVPDEHRLDSNEVERAINEAESEARRRGIAGGRRTPFLLEAMVKLTGGRAMEANVALLASNARLAAAVAGELADFR